MLGLCLVFVCVPFPIYPPPPPGPTAAAAAAAVAQGGAGGLGPTAAAVALTVRAPQALRRAAPAATVRRRVSGIFRFA